MVGSFSPLGNYDINFETGRMLWVGRLHAANYFTIEQINPLNWTLQAVATSTTTNYQTVHHYYIASFLYWPFLVNNSVEFLAELVKNFKWPPLSFELFMELNWTENTCWSDIKCQNQEIRREGGRDASSHWLKGKSCRSLSSLSGWSSTHLTRLQTPDWVIFPSSQCKKLSTLTYNLARNILRQHL